MRVTRSRQSPPSSPRPTDATTRQSAIAPPIVRATVPRHTATPALRHPSPELARREAKHSRPSPDGTGGLVMKRSIHTLGLAMMLAGTLASASPASAAFVSLPSSGAQVNDDPANTIDPDEDAGLVDVAGGTVVAGNKQVPWAAFEQKLGPWQEIFVRAFKNGEWVTQGSPASLNIDQRVVAEAPSIDFAGAGRTVPWVAWYEPNRNFGEPTNIFASRFNAGANAWLPSGQDRTADLRVPSLNIPTNRTAENPSVAGGATVAGNDPVPWIVWEENDGGDTDVDSPRQIFVSKGVKQPAAGTPCTGFKPSSANNLNGFCFQQVGHERLDSGQLP